MKELIIALTIALAVVSVTVAVTTHNAADARVWAVPAGN